MVGRQGTRATPRQSYRSLLEQHVIPRLGGKRLAELKPSHLTDAYGRSVADSIAPGRSKFGPATVQRINGVLRSALSDAMNDGYVSRNVASLVRLPKVPRPQISWWEVWARPRIHRAHPRGPSPGALARGGAGAPLGRCHARNRRWRLATRKSCQAVLAVGGETLRGEPKTDAGVRVVVLDPATIAPPPHRGFTSACRWRAAYDVSGLLGHSSLSITADTYGHVLDDSRQAADRAMAARLDA